MKKALLLLLFFPLATIAIAEEIPTGRLPADVRPLEYNLTLTIDPAGDGFSGVSKIQIQLDHPRNVLWIHGRDLHATKSEVTLAGSRTETIPATYKQVTEEGVARLDLPKSIGPGTAEILIEYQGSYDKAEEGLFKITESGLAYAFTQFESIDARRCFPGFDEPAYKTPYNISIITKNENEAVTNTLPAKEERLPNGMKQITFHRTAKLPTYLIAFAVGPLDVVQGKAVPADAYRKESVPVRGIALKGKGTQIRYAVEHAGDFISLLEKYFRIAYPFEKMDIIAIPGFGGAMENAGAVTFGEDLLLFDEKTAPINQVRRYASVTAHEFAHQWFGDMVTMPWWDDIWLNEAFATWMGAKILQEWRPSFHADVEQLESGLKAMDEDSLISARQIREPIKSSDDIFNAFDTITYQKGGAVLRMFERFSTPEAFRTGIHHYLMKYQSGNATTDDFLNAVSEGSGKPITEHFRTFLFQPGVPFLSVNVQCTNGKTTVELQQKRYLPIGSKGSADKIWHVPVSLKYAVKGKTQEQDFLVDQPKATFDLSSNSCPDWVMPNSDGAGYYKWIMPKESLTRLRNSGMQYLSTRELLSLADSVKAAFANGTLPAADALQMLQSYAASNDRFVATQSMDLIQFFRDHFSHQQDFEKAEDYGRRLYGPLNSKLGLSSAPPSNKDEDAQFLRTNVLEFLGTTVEDPKVRSTAKSMAAASDPKAIDPNIRKTILTIGVQDSDASYTQKLKEDFKRTNDQLLKNELLSAIGSARNPAAIEDARQMVFDRSLHPNEFFGLLEALARDPRTLDADWEWVVKDFDKIYSIIPKSDVFLAGALPLLAVGFCNQEKAEEVRAFFKDKVKSMPGAPRNLAKALERIELCATRMKAQEQSAREFFSQAAP